MEDPYASFKRKIRTHYRKHGRIFPWRKTKDPYRILVSEMMLQQTQVSRVLPKYIAFVERFPSVEDLANASLSDVLMLWQGLGYNRRARYLHRTAQTVVSRHNGIIPREKKELMSLPGVGVYTAGAIRAFAFNQADVLIETNIRTVFIHFFFQNKKEVHDRDILLLAEKTMDRKEPREWFNALMDYGSMLKETGEKLNAKSVHYTKQSAFAGSDRELRGRIIRELLKAKRMTKHALLKSVQEDRARMEKVLRGLEKDLLVKRQGKSLSLA